MADIEALSLCGSDGNTTFERSSMMEDRSDLNDLVGCIFWLKAADQTQQYLRYNLSKDACNHPCLIVDVCPSLTDEVRRVRICIITSFKHKSPIERATILRKRHGLVPISPNSADPAPTFGLQLQPNVTLRRDSWVNLAKTFVVDITIIKKYDDNARSLHYKLAPISITDVRHVLGLTTPRERCTTRVEPVLGAVVHTASQATMEPLPYMNQDVVVGRRDQLNEYTPLVEGSARRSNHDAEARSCSNIVARGGLFNDEAFRQHQTPPIPAHPGSGRGEPWLLLRIYRWLSSWRRVRLWLPSSQTVTSLVVTGLLVAAGGGVIYGGYLLLKVIYTAMAGCYHEIAAVGAHIIASIVGAWKWCTKIVRVSGQGVVHGERAIVEALGGMVAIVKALLGRH